MRTLGASCATAIVLAAAVQIADARALSSEAGRCAQPRNMTVYLSACGGLGDPSGGILTSPACSAQSLVIETACGPH